MKKVIKFEIAFIGNGKLTKSSVKGLLLTGVNPKQILVIGRETSDLSLFEFLGIATSRNIMDAKNVPTIMLMVTPAGTGYWLNEIQKIKIKTPYVKKLKNSSFVTVVPQKIFCFVSGSNIADISSFLGIQPICIIKATTNTNVAYGQGIICLSPYPCLSKREQMIFKKLGTVIVESSKRVHQSITTVGAINAIHAKFIILLFQNQKRLNLKDYLTNIILKKTAGKITKGSLRIYLQNMKFIFNRWLGYNKEMSGQRVEKTFYNTVETLLQIEDIAVKKIDEHIATVATRGGCTQKGLDKMNTNKISFSKLKDIILSIYNRAKQFKQEAKDSLKEYTS